MAARRREAGDERQQARHPVTRPGAHPLTPRREAPCSRRTRHKSPPPGRQRRATRAGTSHCRRERRHEARIAPRQVDGDLRRGRRAARRTTARRRRASTLPIPPDRERRRRRRAPRRYAGRAARAAARERSAGEEQRGPRQCQQLVAPHRPPMRQRRRGGAGEDRDRHARRPAPGRDGVTAAPAHRSVERRRAQAGPAARSPAPLPVSPGGALETRLKMISASATSGRWLANPRTRAAAEAPWPRASTTSTTGQPVKAARSAECAARRRRRRRGP